MKEEGGGGEGITDSLMDHLPISHLQGKEGEKSVLPRQPNKSLNRSKSDYLFPIPFIPLHVPRLSCKDGIQPGPHTKECPAMISAAQSFQANNSITASLWNDVAKMSML